MRKSIYFLLLLPLAFVIGSCSKEQYPENLSRSERKAYYEAYNASYNKAEKDADNTQEEKNAPEPSEETSSKKDRNPNSIPFSIKNNSIFPHKLAIAGNVLAFKPLETRYVGFEKGTKCYLLKSKTTKKYLFSVQAEDEGKSYTIF